MIRLSQRALAYLNEVIHHGSLRRAAQHLNIDPSAISRQLASLEEHLGVRLLQRTRKAWRLPRPASCWWRTTASNGPTKKACCRVVGPAGLRQGKVRLAVGEGFIADLISQPLQSFILRYPGIELEVRMAGANEGVALVKEDAVDLALVYAPVEDGELDVHVDTRQPLDLIIPANHALAGHRGAVPMRALRNESLALIHNSTGMGQLAVIAAQLERIELRPKLRTNSVAVLTIRQVRHRRGLHAGVDGQPRDRGRAYPLPAAGPPALRDARARIVSHKGRELTVAAIACLEHLRRGMRFFSGDAPGLSQR